MIFPAILLYLFIAYTFIYFFFFLVFRSRIFAFLDSFVYGDRCPCAAMCFSPQSIEKKNKRSEDNIYIKKKDKKAKFSKEYLFPWIQNIVFKNVIAFFFLYSLSFVAEPCKRVFFLFFFTVILSVRI